MTNPWVVYPDKNTALHGLDDCDAKWGYPIHGTNLATGEVDTSAQPTTTWATPVERIDNKWCFPAPPDEYMPSTGYESIEEYDESWFAFPPVNLTAPVISGGRVLGQTATCSDGTWEQTPDQMTFAYQWRRDGDDIAGATENSYTFVTEDHYRYFTCVVTATNVHGSTKIETPQQWGPIGP